MSPRVDRVGILLAGLSLVAAGCGTDVAAPEVADPAVPAPLFSLSGSSVTTATPVGASLGAGGVISGIELSVLRGFIHSDRFSVRISVAENDGTDHGTQTFLLSDGTVFGTSGSQASIGIDWGGNTPIEAGNNLDVCATVLLEQPDGTTEFSEEVCSTLNP